MNRSIETEFNLRRAGIRMIDNLGMMPQIISGQPKRMTISMKAELKPPPQITSYEPNEIISRFVSPRQELPKAKARPRPRAPPQDIISKTPAKKETEAERSSREAAEQFERETEAIKQVTAAQQEDEKAQEAAPTTQQEPATPAQEPATPAQEPATPAKKQEPATPAKKQKPATPAQEPATPAQEPEPAKTRKRRRTSIPKLGQDDNYYKDYNAPEMRKALANAGLNDKGLRAELIKRLKSYTITDESKGDAAQKMSQQEFLDAVENESITMKEIEKMRKSVKMTTAELNPTQTPEGFKTGLKKLFSKVKNTNLHPKKGTDI